MVPLSGSAKYLWCHDRCYQTIAGISLCWRYRRYEYHAGIGHRADSWNRCSSGATWQHTDEFLIEVYDFDTDWWVDWTGSSAGLASVLGSAMSQMLEGTPVTVSLTVSIVSLLFSATIGVLFGILPANKASKVDQLKHWGMNNIIKSLGTRLLWSKILLGFSRICYDIV